VLFRSIASYIGSSAPRQEAEQDMVSSLNRCREEYKLGSMRRPVRIERRFIAVVGIIALAFAYLPGVVSALSASPSATCCAVMLCPMHHMSGGHPTCDADPARRGTTCEACAAHHSLQYKAGAVFNRVSPPLVTSERPTGTAPALLQIASASLEPEVLSPPPRLALS
jgi:hypothetical protein